jgi:hypothetical protein
VAFGEGRGLSLAGAARFVALAADALVFGLQVAEASLKDLAACTGNGLHILVIGEALALTSARRRKAECVNSSRGILTGASEAIKQLGGGGRT